MTAHDILDMTETNTASNLASTGAWHFEGRVQDAVALPMPISVGRFSQVAIDCALAPADLPGPGAYDGAAAPKPGNAAGAVTQFVSKSPMAHDVQVKDQQRTPGPGAYTIVGSIDRALNDLQDAKLLFYWMPAFAIAKCPAGCEMA
ncbi:Ank2 [Symbiodinium natans]|uniref:Ank2 protein n=1 Tax=Symbiodinium natans TaxID=878477 RepID=A0A812SIZ1_9DINO|nr:Ank2 [Symbiodinium natans]